jgi:S-adenosylmethionine synthetase
MLNNRQIVRTAEHVSEGHPDKFCDQVADRILDQVYILAGKDQEVRKKMRTAIECLAKDNLLAISGEIRLTPEVSEKLDVTALAKEVWARIGYGDSSNLTVINHIQTQSAEISGEAFEPENNDALSGADQGGAGDQGIMVGYATNETTDFLPQCYVYARDICRKLQDLRLADKRIKSDAKTQITLNEKGEVTSVIVAVQHSRFRKGYLTKQDLENLVVEKALKEVLPNIPKRVIINGTGLFTIGGPVGDAGVVGRKIVVDAYGPQVPVGGGAYSGKDPTKVDRSAAYMARYIAKQIVAQEINGSTECLVKLAYGIGQIQPEMIFAVTDKGDVSKYIREKFQDLSPGFIIDFLGLRNPTGDPTKRLSEKEGWNYVDTAAYGHYGRSSFPWEQLK